MLRIGHLFIILAVLMFLLACGPIVQAPTERPANCEVKQVRFYSGWAVKFAKDAADDWIRAHPSAFIIRQDEMRDFLFLTYCLPKEKP